MWHLTATGTTPAPVLETLLDHLAAGKAWDTTIGSPVTEKTVTAATQPLTDAGWEHTVDGRWIRWTNPSRDAGIRFDAFAAQNPNSPLTTWTIWAGPSMDQPAWSACASAYTPAGLLADLSGELAQECGTRQVRTPSARRFVPVRAAASPVPLRSYASPHHGPQH
ncbi:DUF317 domain-containing protein [Streptomyces sp. NPDC048281]|uniref:DUF317 domain-containing protein n=1 Tax=Streptomyces sp. NPDC048281 TaxID=3154715 RepID=UPI003428C791